MNWKFWQKMEVQDPAANNAENIGGLVQVPNLTVGQILDAFSGSGDSFLGSFYKPHLYGRNRAVCYLTLSRAIDLIASVGSYLFCNGYWRVCDFDGNTLDGMDVQILRDIVSYKMDGRDPSSQTVQDCIADLLTEGNFLLGKKYDRMGNLTHLHRLVPYTARIKTRSTNGDIYEVEDANWPDGKLFDLPASDVVHGRYVHLRRAPRDSRHMGFAFAPIGIMRPALEIGQELDDYVLKFVKRSPYQNLNVSFKMPDDVSQRMTEEQQTQITRMFQQRLLKERGYTFLEDATITDVTPKISKDLATEREYQKQDVGTFLGVPAPLLGVNVTSWGSGIAELSKLARNYGFMIHIQRFLDAVAAQCLRPGSQIELDWLRLYGTDPDGFSKIIQAAANPQLEAFISKKEARRLLGLGPEMDGEPVKTVIAEKGEIDNNNVAGDDESEQTEDEDSEMVLNLLRDQLKQ